MVDVKYKTVDERQSFVAKTGKQWENQVMDFLNSRLRNVKSDLLVIKGDLAKKDPTLKSKLSIPVGKSGSRKAIWGDIDLIVIDKNKNLVGVISCKISLHGRFSETLFYAVVLKELIPDLKFLFATSDKGRQAKGKPWQSEWGSEEKPTKDRDLGSHYLDGIYVLNPKTNLGGMVKSLEDLPKDLVKWHKRQNP